jgi:DNA-binding NarL/FixJ family response regulator
MSNIEITEALFLREATVKTHVANIAEKLAARDCVQAAAAACEWGPMRLLPPVESVTTHGSHRAACR